MGKSAGVDRSVIGVAILGILAAVTVPNLAGFLTTGNVAAANTEVANVELAALAYYANHDGTWPDSSTVLETDYLSGLTTYATYSFDEWGKVKDPVLKEGITGIKWVASDHEWQKS